MGRNNKTYQKNDPRLKGRGGPGVRGQLRRDLTMVLIQKLNEAEKNKDRPRMFSMVDKLYELAMEGGGAVYNKDGKLLKRYGDLEAIKYIFDRLEGRPSQSMRIFKDNLVRVEFRSYEEIRDGLLDQGIDIERLPDIDRLEGRPSQSMRIFKDNLVRVEFRSYEEIRDGLLDQGIDIERLPDMRELSDDVDDVTEG